MASTRADLLHLDKPSTYGLTSRNASCVRIVKCVASEMRKAPELHTPTLSRNHHLRVGSPVDEIYEKSTDLGRGSNHSDPEGRLLVILTIRHADHLLSSRQRPRGRTGPHPQEKEARGVYRRGMPPLVNSSPAPLRVL